MIKNKTYFGNKIVLNRQIWVERTINSPADMKTTIPDQYKEQIIRWPNIVLKSRALSTIASSITLFVILSSTVLLFLIIYKYFTVGTVSSPSFTLLVRVSLLVDCSLMLLGELQD